MATLCWKEGLGEISQMIKNHSLLLLNGMVHLTRVELPIWGISTMTKGTVSLKK